MLLGISLLRSVVGIKALESPGNSFLLPVCGRRDDANLPARMRVKVLGQFQIRQLLCQSQ